MQTSIADLTLFSFVPLLELRDLQRKLQNCYLQERG